MKPVVQDYVPGAEIELDDPTDPDTKVEKSLLEKLGTMITHGEDALSAGEAELDSDEFFEKRGAFLDMLGDEQISSFLDSMRKQGKVPFRSWKVSDG